MDRKYFKPKSLTWWAGFLPVAAATAKSVGAGVPELHPVVSVVDEATGGMSAFQLYSTGFGLIGLRGAFTPSKGTEE